MSRAKSLASFIAGFGTSYFASEKQKRDEERQARKDKADEEERKLRNEEIAMRNADRSEQRRRENEAMAGLDSASKMKVGELRNDDGAIDNSTEAWKQRIVSTPNAAGDLPTEEVAAQTAPIYAQAAAKKGAEKWLSSDAPDAVVGKVKPTTKSDIIRTQADAVSKLGITGLPQAMSLREKADELDIKDLQTKILSATSIDDLNEHYKMFPDGFDLKGETNKETGKLSYWYENDAGEKRFPDKAMPQDFDNFQKMKEFAASFVSGNPQYVMEQYDKWRKNDREDRKLAREEKVSDAQLTKYQQDIDKGKLELASLPESIQLDLKAKKANINQSNAAAESSRASAAKTKSEATGGGDKLPADAKMMNYLIANGVAKSQKEAFEMINKTDENGLIIKSAMEVLSKDPYADVGQAIANAKSVVKGVRNSTVSPEKKPSYEHLYK